MGKKRNRFISSVLMVLLLASLLTVSASAADVIASGDCGSYFNQGGWSSVKWMLTSDGVLTISGTGKMEQWSLTREYAPWYVYRAAITSVVIEEGVTDIGDYAFNGCSFITSISLPEGLTSIRSGTFRNCASLTSINIPVGVTDINNFAFSGINALASITVAAGNKVYYSSGNCLIEKVTQTLILGCKKSVIPEGVTSIGEQAFGGCNELTSVTIPSSVTSIGKEAFRDCSSLTSVTIPSSVTSIGEGAFRGCSSLTSVTIPDSVTSIGVCAFYECSALASISLPEGITSISGAAFENCTSLTSITIPSGVTSISDSAFMNCSSLTSVTIPSSVTSIGKEAFRGCSSLTSVTIPDSVTSIGEQAFFYCTSLTSVTIPSSVTEINIGILYGCSSLTSVTIPSGVTDILSFAFKNCDSLSSVIIPLSVTDIGPEAFYGCGGLTVYYSGSIRQWNAIRVNYGNDALLHADIHYGDQPAYTATLTDTGRSLSLSDLVFINQYCTIESENLSSAYICANGGLLVWPSQPQEASFANAQTNGYVQQGLVASGSEYTQRTNGIIAKNYGDTFFMCIYLKMPDGSYLYTPLKEYGVVTYCNNKIASATASQTLKTMCQTMQAYGAAAKAYFG